MHKSTKRYGHDVGLSAVFRQWRADSHCNQLHGYALAVTLTFGATKLDSRNWVVDFGALKPVKDWLAATFDHKLLVAKDDPQLERILSLQDGEPGAPHLAFPIVVEAVGCEAFAQLIYGRVDRWLPDYVESCRRMGLTPPANLHLISVEVAEHGANSAIYQPLDIKYHGNI